MNKESFEIKLRDLISKAEAQKDEGNVIDLRAFVPRGGDSDLLKIFNSTEINEAWKFVKDHDHWFIDIYENITGENRAEYIDLTLFSD